MDTKAELSRRMKNLERTALEVKDAFQDYAAVLAKFGEFIQEYKSDGNNSQTQESSIAEEMNPSSPKFSPRK